MERCDGFAVRISSRVSSSRSLTRRTSRSRIGRLERWAAPLGPLDRELALPIGFLPGTFKRSGVTVTSDCHSRGTALELEAAAAFGGSDGVAVVIVEAGVEEGAPIVDPPPHRRQVGEAV